MISEYIAHESLSGHKQSVSSHLTNTATKAAKCLRVVNLEKTAYIAGLLHDIGKYSNEFQAYIQKKSNAERGSVIHSFQGCQFILKSYHNTEDAYTKLTAEIIAYAISAHHGLFDCFGKETSSGFAYREQKKNIGYDVSLSAFFADVDESKIVNHLFFEAKAEIQSRIESLDEFFSSDDEFAFSVGMLQRLILSALIEGDRQDTAEFMSCAVFPHWPEDMRPIWDARLAFMMSKLSALSGDSPIAKARQAISDTCFAVAALPCGIYRLNAPTGGGKTLAALRYALAHARKWNKKRIIFTSPLLSILEQNAAVIRDFVGDDSLVLEHHSNVVQESLSREELDERELFIQTWDSPIIITTMVQLLNTIFDGKASSIRRFHSLCDSIIIMDEVQTVPTKMLTLFNLAIQFLSKICGTTIILCSATQPYFEKTDHPIRIAIQDLVPYDESLWRVFRRTTICPLAPRREEEIPDLIRVRMASVNSLLVVCNKKNEAARLYRLLKNGDYTVFHLSAAMCIQHRRDTVNALKASLDKGDKTLCISTQVIEAGVDISFQCVLRFAAGMDNVIQAAGRCNRNGESGIPQSVYLVNVTDEKLGNLKEIQRGKTASIALLNAFERAQEHFENDLSSEASIRFFYEKYYSDMEKGFQDYSLPGLNTTIFDLLSANEKYTDGEVTECGDYLLRQAFKTAGQKFEVFDASTHDVIVPYGEGKDLIVNLCSARAENDMVYRSHLLKKVRAYSVSVYDWQMKNLLQIQAVYPICGDYAYALSEQNYDKAMGLAEETTVQSFLEV